MHYVVNVLQRCYIITTGKNGGVKMKPKVLFGEFFKQKRIDGGMTLREFCKKFGCDPGNMSKMERGLLSPPTEKKLEEYASFLGIPRGSNDWYEFFDRAAACKGEIPEEIMQDEEIFKSLPLIFRTFRNKKVSKKTIEELIDKLKHI